jgi:hypothetical protein
VARNEAQNHVDSCTIVHLSGSYRYKSDFVWPQLAVRKGLYVQDHMHLHKAGSGGGKYRYVQILKASMDAKKSAISAWRSPLIAFSMWPLKAVQWFVSLDTTLGKSTTLQSPSCA